MDKTQTIFRKAKGRENPYVMISKDVMNDHRLSWKETGLLCYLLSLPNDWQLYIHEITNHKTDGIKATRSGIKRLLALGYLEKRIFRDSKKRIIKHEYIIHEKPLSQKVKVGKGTLLSNDCTNTLPPHNRQDYFDEERWNEINNIR